VFLLNYIFLFHWEKHPCLIPSQQGNKAAKDVPLSLHSNRFFEKESESEKQTHLCFTKKSSPYRPFAPVIIAYTRPTAVLTRFDYVTVISVAPGLRNMKMRANSLSCVFERCLKLDQHYSQIKCQVPHLYDVNIR
jgi:hypothetical protein